LLGFLPHLLTDDNSAPNQLSRGKLLTGGDDQHAMSKPVSSQVINVAAPPAAAITVKVEEMHDCSGTTNPAKRAIPKKATSKEKRKSNSEVKVASNVDNSDESGTTGPTGGNEIPTLEKYTSHVRQYHNRVGKRYRDKLNGQFESLQAALCVDDEGNEEEQYPGEPRDAKHTTLNKAKVLDMARERIQVLLREREALGAERKALMQEPVHGGC
jgi:hypothetical protein